MASSIACGPSDTEGDVRGFRKEGRAGIVIVEGKEVFHDGEWRKQGPFIFRDRRGVVIAEGSFENGLEVGPWVQTLDDGARGEGNFEAGSRSGEWRYYHRNGALQDVGSYDRGLRTGLWRSFRDDETLLREAEYDTGKLHGRVTRYRPDGETVDPEGSGTYVKGKLQD